MGRVFLVAKTEDIYKIFDELDRYMFETGETSPYLFMSKSTLAAIDSVTMNITYDFMSQKVKSNGVIAEFHGYKIYINNELGLGEVEIR